MLALMQGLWLAYDGCHALVTGDYTTPGSGPRAGQLGPWSRLVSALGVEPRSTFIKCLHVFLGIAWLIASVVFIKRPAAGRGVVFGCAMASLWYLPVGTLLSLLVMALLLTRPVRNMA